MSKLTCRFENFESAAHDLCRNTTNDTHSLFNKSINLCAVCTLSASYRQVNLHLFTGRMPRSGKLPVLNLLTGQNQVFRPALVRTIHVKLGRANGHAGPLGCAKFQNAAPKYQKFRLFRKESRYSGDSLERFRKFLGGFIRPTILYCKMCQISCDSHHRLRSYC